MSEILDKNMNFYQKVIDNDKLKKNLEQGLFEIVYSKHKNKKLKNNL